MMQQGTVFWITGLSGAGKTTVAKLLTFSLREKGLPVVLLDGDDLREIFNEQTEYDIKQRLQLSYRYSKLCYMLAKQGAYVVIATISMFHKTQTWNRKHIEKYIEIYLKVPLDVLKARDTKGIYALAQEGKLNNIVGLDLTFEEPLSPDLVIDNYGYTKPEYSLSKIMEFIALRKSSCIN